MDFIIKPIASLLGKILDLLFIGLDTIGLGNIAIAIILFTLIVKLLMLPLTMKQTKMMKLNSIITPEVKAIQEKYKNKRDDQAAMLKMQDETKAVYEKYGTSQMGGCVQLLIQFPILIALYRVFQYIPLYIGNLKDLFINFLGDSSKGISGITQVQGYVETMSNNFNVTSVSDWTNMDQVITAMNSFTAEQWTKLGELFPDFATVIAENHVRITEMNTFLGINVSQIPTLGLTISVLIPILAGLSQFISTKLTQTRSMEDDEDNPAAASMKMMTLFMPIMSVFLAFSVPAGLGLYWTATAVFQTILHLIINHYYNKIGVDEIIRKNTEKRNKKRAKQGLPPEKIAKNATASTKKLESLEKNKQRIADLEAKKEENDKKIKEILESTKYYKTAKPGSLAEKAGMVSKYNEKNTKNSK